MPDIALTVAGAAATQAGGCCRPPGSSCWTSRATTRTCNGPYAAAGRRGCPHTVTRHHPRTDLDGVREILVRPDGHIAWATRTTSVSARRTERNHALTSWAGHPARG